MARIKGKCYGSDPVVISLQLTHFQSLISLRMNHIIFRELKCHDTCLTCLCDIITITFPLKKSTVVIAQAPGLIIHFVAFWRREIMYLEVPLCPGECTLIAE